MVFACLFVNLFGTFPPSSPFVSSQTGPNYDILSESVTFSFHDIITDLIFLYQSGHETKQCPLTSFS